MLSADGSLEQIFKHTRAYLTPEGWDRFRTEAEKVEEAENFTGFLERFPFAGDGPEFLPDLALLEWAVHRVQKADREPDPAGGDWSVNPTLQLIRLSFKNLPGLLREPGRRIEPEAGEEMVLVWLEPRSRALRLRPARDADLLALKMVLEEISPEAAATVGGVARGGIEGALARAGSEGILIAPRTLIRRGSGRRPGPWDHGPAIPGGGFFHPPVAHYPGLRPPLQTLLRPQPTVPPDPGTGAGDYRGPETFLPGKTGPGPDQLQRREPPAVSAL